MRRASCGCGQLAAECLGEPGRVSVCHCLACQRRTGSAFSAQARFPAEAVTITGTFKTWQRDGEGGGVAEFHFCPDCGATVFYRIDAMPGLLAIPLGAFADPGFPAPAFSVYENRKHVWVEITGDVEHD